MNDLIQRITNAITRQEGMPPDYDNPGNCRGCPWLAPTSQYARVAGGFWRPASRIVGEAGLAHVVALHISQGNSLRDFIAGHPGVYSGFAPGADGNKTEVYIANVMEWAAVPSADVPLWEFVVSSAMGPEPVRKGEL